MSSGDEITNLLSVVLIIMMCILLILIVTYIVIRVKMNSDKKTKEEKENIPTSSRKNATSYNKQSIFNFMEFDKIEDNMIVKKQGQKYLMVIEFQGINYDLMSGVEKNGVEQGFLQFLNTLRYPIQIYIQTRTVNLESGIIRYKERMKGIRSKMVNQQMKVNQMQVSAHSEEELQEAKLELTRDRNLYEYGVDIINNTERMSLNKNILRKHYYIIISYTPEQTSNDYQIDEIASMAFSDLYTKAHAIISALSVTGVSGKVLDSNELTELLYIAYNRDESEVFNFDKAMEAGYDELYSTAPDVFEKRIKELDKKIEEESIIKANEAINEVVKETAAQREARQKEEELDDLISQMAEMVLAENEQLIGKDIADKAKEKVRRGRPKKTKTKEEVKNES